MSQIETADFILDADEPTWGMSVFEDGSGFCTKIVVIRGDLPVGLVIHHGPDPEMSGRIPPLFVPSVEGENNVGLMLQMSEEHRHDLRHWKRIQRYKAESTLIPDIIRQEAEAREWIHNRSSFGPYQTTERNGYSHQTTVRKWFTERDRRRGYKEFFING